MQETGEPVSLNTPLYSPQAAASLALDPTLHRRQEEILPKQEGLYRGAVPLPCEKQGLGDLEEPPALTPRDTPASHFATADQSHQVGPSLRTSDHPA